MIWPWPDLASILRSYKLDLDLPNSIIPRPRQFQRGTSLKAPNFGGLLYDFGLVDRLAAWQGCIFMEKSGYFPFET